jgi:hypothetical protein
VKCANSPAATKLLRKKLASWRIIVEKILSELL